MNVLTLLMKDRISRRRVTRKEDHSAPIAENILTIKIISLKKIDIMTELLERNNIDVPEFARREKYVDPQGHYNTVQFKGDDSHDLVVRIHYV